MQVNGNITGIPQRLVERLEAVDAFPVERDQLIGRELAQELGSLTAVLNKEIAVYLDRRDRVIHIAVGNDFTVPLEDLSRRRGEKRLSGLRCVHTHPGGDGSLSPVDLSALEVMRFDCMTALGIRQDGSVADGETAFLGIDGRWNSGESFYFSSLEELIHFPFLRRVEEIESQFPKLLEVSSESAERALLIGMQSGRDRRMAEESLAELEQLALSAGLVVLGQDLQQRARPDAATYIGRGKVGEIQLVAQSRRADVLVFDDELSPAQERNLEEATGIKVIDRTMLILDIFAQRARSSEGKLQVELAQLKYLLPRLMGQGLILSRLGGGIGTRGPGETKLEVDRRRIRKRISELEQRLGRVEKARNLHRQNRKTREWPTVSLVGYTNAGKSTLMNRLTGAGVLVENKLFATLDPTTRLISLPDKKQILLIDTVGFIKKLPHHLVAAFSATLEETLHADLLLHVLDAASPQATEQAAAVQAVLKSLGADAKPVLTVLNKTDLVENEEVLDPLLLEFAPAVAISAEKNIGLERLLDTIRSMLPETREKIRTLIPFKDAQLAAEVRARGVILREEYTQEGVIIEALVDRRLKGLLEKNSLSSGEML